MPAQTFRKVVAPRRSEPCLVRMLRVSVSMPRTRSRVYCRVAHLQSVLLAHLSCFLFEDGKSLISGHFPGNLATVPEGSHLVSVWGSPDEQRANIEEPVGTLGMLRLLAWLHRLGLPSVFEFASFPVLQVRSPLIFAALSVLSAIFRLRHRCDGCVTLVQPGEEEDMTGCECGCARCCSREACARENPPRCQPVCCCDQTARVNPTWRQATSRGHLR